jgi:hypothetical protein
MDWIDAEIPGGHAFATRTALYDQMHGLLSGYLHEVSHVKIADVDAAARFWLDGLIGHVRGVPRDGEAQDQWAKTFARYFLRAVSE